MRRLLALIILVHASVGFAEVNCRGMDLIRNYEVKIIDNIVEKAAIVNIENGGVEEVSDYINVVMDVKDDHVSINGRARDFSLVIDRFQDARIYKAQMFYGEYAAPLECKVF